jgi:cell division protein ZapA
MEKNRTVIKLCGQSFTISSLEGDDYLHKISAYVEEQIAAVQRAYPSLSTHNCALLAALNLSDELHKLKADYAALGNRIDQLRNLPRTDTLPKGPVKRPFEATAKK